MSAQKWVGRQCHRRLLDGTDHGQHGGGLSNIELRAGNRLQRQLQRYSCLTL